MTALYAPMKLTKYEISYKLSMYEQDNSLHCGQSDSVVMMLSLGPVTLYQIFGSEGS